MRAHATQTPRCKASAAAHSSPAPSWAPCAASPRGRSPHPPPSSGGPMAALSRGPGVGEQGARVLSSKPLIAVSCVATRCAAIAAPARRAGCSPVGVSRASVTLMPPQLCGHAGVSRAQRVGGVSSAVGGVRYAPPAQRSPGACSAAPPPWPLCVPEGAHLDRVHHQLGDGRHGARWRRSGPAEGRVEALGPRWRVCLCRATLTYERTKSLNRSKACPGRKLAATGCHGSQQAPDHKKPSSSPTLRPQALFWCRYVQG